MQFNKPSIFFNRLAIVFCPLDGTNSADSISSSSSLFLDLFSVSKCQLSFAFRLENKFNSSSAVLLIGFAANYRCIKIYQFFAVNLPKQRLLCNDANGYLPLRKFSRFENIFVAFFMNYSTTKRTDAH